ncbi:D-methionine transport system substrate-binding protein [Labedella gwakjiensis]|uniref:D-methionine transport system substrate-binding protein n=1 Tax=Labedella gwakjiensis TaxID=390269 RepID=A0A2P8GR47_9MICO|nr:MetQ/NlpA family ABC transporter substrate-binding protein [Labedella gwakjiensis]PSL36440.1 D-methionine transport system substrate-binding protein [Labedella gwakjiensis]RUQ85634.1 methionine ABC transporter substrate-binding protein [Labedella gwakjiensis]
MPITRKRIAAAISGIALVGLLAGCGAGAGDAPAAEDKGTEANPVKIGVVGASDPYWDDYVDAAADEGITVELVDFAEYTQPNPALTAGELDLNQFQHIVYLAQYNEEAGEDLQPIGSTAIYPLPLYSTQYDSVEDIPDGAEIAIPNDESNQARALLVLQSAGLIELEGGGDSFSTPDDIIADDSRVTVTPLAADLTATSLPDVAAAIINNDFATKAGLSADDVIAQDDPNDPNALPYVNVFAARSADADNETYAKLVEIYQDTKAVTDGVVDNSGGTAVMVKIPAEDLVSSLETVQTGIAEQG